MSMENWMGFYHYLRLISTILAVASFITVIVIFIRFQIAKVFLFLTGRSAKVEIEKLNQRNKETGQLLNRSKKFHKIPISKELQNTNADSSLYYTRKKAVIKFPREVEVEQSETEDLTVENKDTEVMIKEALQRERGDRPASDHFKVIEKIMIVHTKERLQKCI